jgi:hypothetical protein
VLSAVALCQQELEPCDRRVTTPASRLLLLQTAIMRRPKVSRPSPAELPAAGQTTACLRPSESTRSVAVIWTHGPGTSGCCPPDPSLSESLRFNGDLLRSVNRRAELWRRAGIARFMQPEPGSPSAQPGRDVEQIGSAGTRSASRNASTGKANIPKTATLISYSACLGKNKSI